MRRLLFDVPRWSVVQHRWARGMSSVDDSDPPALKLADELFQRLYGGEVTALSEAQQDVATRGWATRVHDICTRLPQFERLASQCRGDADAAAAAVETLLDELKPQMDEPELRSAARCGCARATAVVDQVQEAIEGLEGVGIGRMPGSATSVGNSGDGAPARSLAARMKADPRLLRIAKLAGRFRRIADTKRRTRLHHGADEVSEIELGADVQRLLPTELVKLRHPRLRLAMLRDFVEKRCLQYKLIGVGSLGKGPVVACVDKSGSMSGDNDIWATAVALALLQVAQAERRPFALVCFNGSVIFEAIVHPGEALPEAALFTSCSGGTSIDSALRRGLEIIQTNPGQLRQADIVLITDGGSDGASAPALRERAAAFGVAILGIGIGVEPSALEPWCDTIASVTDLSTLEPKVADGLFGG